MAALIEIQCVKKTDRPNPWERIRQVGGLNPNGSRWALSQEEAIAAIRNGTYTFMVRRGRASVKVIVATSRFGNPYLKSEADGEEPNNLLSLPECP